MGGADHTPVQRDAANDPSDLSSYFEKSASLVHDYTNRFEHQYARPALSKFCAFYNDHPISATFVAIFSALSICPVLLFLGTSLFAIAFFTIIALSVVIFASLAVIIGLSFPLFFILSGAFFISTFLTAMATSTYFLARLIVLVRQGGASGVSDWVGETKRHILDITRRPQFISSRLSEARSTTESPVEPQNPDAGLYDGFSSDYGAKVQGE